MANFDPPFSQNADKRYPTSDERQNGFACGPADQELFNGMFHALHAEVGGVIDYAGLTQTNDRFTQLREAIEAMIATAIGLLPEDEQPDLTGFILMSQGRTRLPIFPEVQNVDGRIVITSPGAGTIRIPGGVTFLHRGIFPVTTSQQDFATVANKIYHLRWSSADGYQLLDTGNIGYNPGSLPETDIAFDSSYDSMLIARIITNGANIATITNLANKNRLLLEIQNNGAVTDQGTNSSQRVAQVNWNLARRPVVALHYTGVSRGVGGGNGFPTNISVDHDFSVVRTAFSRYGANYTLGYDFSNSIDIQCTVSA